MTPTLPGRRCTRSLRNTRNSTAIAVFLYVQGNGKWVKCQRRCRDKQCGSNRHLTEQHVAQLDAIGLAWRADENIHSWEHMYEELKGCRRQHGDCLVKQNSGKLGRWVDIQRQRRKGPHGLQKQLTDEQVRLVDEIKFGAQRSDFSNSGIKSMNCSRSIVISMGTVRY